MERYSELVNDKEFIKKLKSSRFFNLLFDKPEVLLIVLCGSRITGITDDHSDYDITILTTNEKCKESDYRLRYEEHDVHWYYHNINDFIYTDEKFPAMNSLCPFLLGLTNEDYIIYKNPKYQNVIDYIFSIKKELLEIGGRTLYKKCLNYIQNPIETGVIDKKYYTKFWGHLIFISDILNNISVDKQLVLAGKRIRYKEITKQQEQAMIGKIKQLKDYIKNNPIDVEDTKENIVRNIKEIMLEN